MNRTHPESTTSVNQSINPSATLLPPLRQKASGMTLTPWVGRNSRETEVANKDSALNNAAIHLPHPTTSATIQPPSQTARATTHNATQQSLAKHQPCNKSAGTMSYMAKRLTAVNPDASLRGNTRTDRRETSQRDAGDKCRCVPRYRNRRFAVYPRPQNKTQVAD